MEVMRELGHRMHRKRLFALGVLLPAMICLLAGCSGGSSSQPPQSQPASTSTALATSSNQANPGNLVTLTCTVQSGGAPVPAGSVSFFDGSASLATTPLNGSGQATWSSSSLATGAHTFSARYAGTTAFAASQSTNVVVTISQPLESSQVTLTASASSSVQGIPAELVAQVAGASSS